MTLIDYFNAFQVRSQGLGLTANARSLYFAILGEFNKSQYPAQLKLGNAYLQHLSGITSSHSFDSARNTLINSGLVSHKKQVYTLETLGKEQGKLAETLREEQGKSAERFGKASLGIPPSIPMPIEKEKEREKTKTTTTATARAREGNGANSVEVQQMWFRCEGQQIPGSMIYALYELEQLHGTENLCKAILTASQNNKENRLTLNFLKAVLEKQLKGGNKNVGTSEPESWESQQPAWL